MMEVCYQFQWLGESGLEKKSLCVNTTPTPSAEPWTLLGFHQCANCPLELTEQAQCPMALAIAPAVEEFGDLNSYHPVTVTISQPGRTISADTTFQRAFASLLGLLVSTSACPRTRFLKPMAYTHLPLALEEETISRAVGHHLISLYLKQRQGQAVEWNLQQLADDYQQLHQVNRGMAERLRAQFENDLSVNAVVILDTFAKAVPMEIEDQLETIADCYKDLEK